MDLRASIDIGSNSILLLIAEVENSKIVREIANESRVTSLGKDIDKTKMFSEDSMRESFNALSEYVDLINQNDIDLNSVIVTATEASRVVRNSNDFFHKVEKELGLVVQLINPAGEAYYTAYGVAAGLNHSEVVIIDIGGASTEFTHLGLNPFEIKYSISLPIGSVRATDWIETNRFEAEIADLLAQLHYFQSKKLDYVGVAGTFTTLGAMTQSRPYDAKYIQGHVLESKDLSQLFSHIAGNTSDEILKEYPYIGKRARSVNGGLRSIIEFAHFLNIKVFELSTYGLRYGVLMQGEISEEYRL